MAPAGAPDSECASKEGSNGALEAACQRRIDAIGHTPQQVSQERQRGASGLRPGESDLVGWAMGRLAVVAFNPTAVLR
jgi:hypothetical protein